MPNCVSSTGITNGHAERRDDGRTYNGQVGKIETLAHETELIVVGAYPARPMFDESHQISDRRYYVTFAIASETRSLSYNESSVPHGAARGFDRPAAVAIGMSLGSSSEMAPAANAFLAPEPPAPRRGSGPPASRPSV
jgi:hypothetical protein